MSVNVNDMVDAMITALQTAGKLNGVEGADLTALRDDMRITENARWSYLLSNMEIKGVKVADPAGTVESYATGVGTNGGVMNAPPYPVTGNVAKAAQTLNQNNDGTGLIA